MVEERGENAKKYAGKMSPIQKNDIPLRQFYNYLIHTIMKRTKIFLALLVFVSMMSTMGLNAQTQTQEAPDWRKLHYLSEEEMLTPVRARNFT